MSKRTDSPYRSGRSPDWIKSKNPNAPAVRLYSRSLKPCPLADPIIAARVSAFMEPEGLSGRRRDFFGHG